MPRNRRPQDREAKRAELVSAATTLFTEHGYDETTMAAIALSAGVTTTTIYWYFEDKDALLLAVLDHVLEQALADFSTRAHEPWGDQLLWAFDRLGHHRRLITVVHARSADSPSVGAWHTGFHDLVDHLVADGLRAAGVPEADLTPMTTLSTFVVEGLLTHPRPPAEARRIVELLAAARR